MQGKIKKKRETTKLNAPEAGVVDFSQSGSALLVEVGISGPDSRLVLFGAGGREFFTRHRIERSKDGVGGGESGCSSGMDGGMTSGLNTKLRSWNGRTCVG